VKVTCALAVEAASGVKAVAKITAPKKLFLID